MKRKTKKILRGLLIVGCVALAAGLVSRVAKGDKEVGGEVTLDFSKTSDLTPVVNEKDVELKGAFKDLAGTNVTQYGYTLEVHGNKSYNTSSVSISGTQTNVSEYELTISGYDEYVKTIDVTMVASEKDDVKVSAWCGLWYMGSEKVGKVSDTYTIDTKLMHKGEIKLVVKNTDPANTTFAITKLVINKSA